MLPLHKWFQVAPILTVILARVQCQLSYYVLPTTDSTLRCPENPSWLCLTLEQLVQTGNFTQGGDNLTFQFLPGEHILTRPLRVHNYEAIEFNGQGNSSRIRFIEKGCIEFKNVSNLEVGGINFHQANTPELILGRSRKSVLVIQHSQIAVLHHSFFAGKIATRIVYITHTTQVLIDNVKFTDNQGTPLHIESQNISISTTEFARNNIVRNRYYSLPVFSLFCQDFVQSGVVEIESENVLIRECEFTDNTNDYGCGIYFHLGQVIIEDSTLVNNTGSSQHGAIFACNTSLLISNSTFINNRAFIGGAISSEHSILNISSCVLMSNMADYGGAMDLSESPFGSANRKISATIQNSEFTNNTAIYGGAISIYRTRKEVMIRGSNFTSNTASYGGALSIDSGNASVFECNLANNMAFLEGGAIESISSTVVVSNSNLIANTVEESGITSLGGAIAVTSSVILCSNSELFDNSARDGASISALNSDLNLTNITFLNNKAFKNGTNLILRRSTVNFYEEALITNNSNIYCISSTVNFKGRATLTNNVGEFGGALQAVHSQVMFDSPEGVTISNNTALNGGGVFLGESLLTIHHPVYISHNAARLNGGGFFLHKSDLECNSVDREVNITGNTAKNGGGVYAVASSMGILESFITVGWNEASVNGGAMYLEENSEILLLKIEPECILYYYSNIRMELKIINNVAQRGGGLFVADDTEIGGTCLSKREKSLQDVDDECFLQTIALYDRTNVTLRRGTPGECQALSVHYRNVHFRDNEAFIAGSDLYGGLLDRCTANNFAEYQASNGSEYFQGIVSPENVSVASDPVRVILCRESDLTISTRKGESFQVSVLAVDQVGTPVNATIFSSLISEVGYLAERQTSNSISNQCTTLDFNAFSADDNAQLELYADGPCSNLGISKQIVYLTFLNCTCPVGFQPISSEISCLCGCHSDLSDHQISTCFQSEQSILVENSDIWIGVEDLTTGQEIITSMCPFDYCESEPVNITLNGSHLTEQCAFGRSGILCGQCGENLSLVFATSRCIKCTNLHLLLLIPFALAGIALVAFILLLNITMAMGTIHGLIFYANILAANKVAFQPFDNNPLTVFISWVNLDLGIETCFYNGMDSQAKVLLQIVFPAYLMLLIAFIIIISHYSSKFSKLLSNRNPVAALATLMILSYSKLLRLIIAALQYTTINYSNAPVLVWWYDGNVEYFTPSHTARFLSATIILAAGLVFTFNLLFGQWFPRCHRWKVMRWTRNTVYTGFMDAYHAPFTPKHRYWLGLLLLGLIIQNLFDAFATNSFLPILIATCLVNGILCLKLLLNRIYKSWLNNALETLFLINLGVLANAILYAESVRDDQIVVIVANISMAIALCLFMMIVFYHFYEYVLRNFMINHTKQKFPSIENGLPIDLRIRKKRSNTPEPYTYEPNTNRPTSSLNSYNDTLTSDFTLCTEESNITMNQLREPDLDILAPVDSTDYVQCTNGDIEKDVVKRDVSHSIVDLSECLEAD